MKEQVPMSYLIAAPEMLAAAAADVAGIGSSLSAAHVAAGLSTTAVIAAAEDEVSAAIAALLSDFGQGYQALSARAAAFHAEFVQALSEAERAYAAAEAGAASRLAAMGQGALAAANASTEAAVGRPLVGNGADGAPGTGQAGAPGGILSGNGGNGGLGAPGQAGGRRSSRSASTTSINGSGPPRFRAPRRTAATDRSSESIASMSRMRAWVAWHPPTDRSPRPTASVYPATRSVSIGVIGSV
jgi:hypothetical protein